MTAQVCLGLEDVEVRTKGGSTVLALPGRLTITTGTFTAVTGPSGSGKTTLLRVLAALAVPTRGRLTAFDRPVRLRSCRARARHRRRDVAVSAQELDLVPGLSVRANVELGQRVRGRLDHAAVRSVLTALGLQDRSCDDVGTLSGGQQRRVSVARALAAGTPVVVVDEPTAGLDPGSAASVITALIGARDAGRTVVASTHEPAVVAVADRVLTVCSGTVTHVEERRRQPRQR